MKQDNRGRPMCDKKGCKNLATRNYQDAFVRWEISKQGEYGKVPEFITAGEETNVHLCDVHDDSENYA